MFLPYYLFIVYYFPIFLFGLCAGSFLNCLAWRLHKEESFWPWSKKKGDSRSYCPKCRKRIAWYDNIPLLSFVILRGKCRQCGKAISLQYPAVELATGLLFVLAFVVNFSAQGGSASGGQFSISNISLLFNFKYLILLRDLFFICTMIIIFIYDLRWYLILDAVTLPACAILFILNLAAGMSWQNLLISGIIGSSFFLLQFIISHGKWIGGGDIRLGLLLGLSLGWPRVVVAILFGYFIGSIVGVGLMIAGKKKWSSQLPLGTFLAPAGIIALLYGSAIVDWYLTLLS